MMSKAAFLLVGILVFARAAQADVITLTDLNTTFAVDAHTQQGAFTWEVDGTDHLFQEWFWYRVGVVSRERSIDTLTLLSHTASDNDEDAGNDRLVISYRHASFLLDVEYNLTGGNTGSGVSTVTETIRIRNTRPSLNLDFHLFEYSDFDLTESPTDDTATRVSPNTIKQTDVFNVSATVTVVNPTPDHYEIAAVPTTLGKLNDGVATNLSDTTTSLGPPANVAFAFQWDEIILPGSTFVVSKQKQIVGSLPGIPEPASLLLVGSGLMGLRYWRRRQVKAVHASS